MIRPLIGYYGGKTKLAKRIAKCFLPHRTFVSTHCGGMSVEIAKQPASIEIANDLDSDLINLYKVVMEHTGDFCAILKNVPYSEQSFKQAKDWIKSNAPLFRAAGFLIRNRMSFSSSGRTFMIDRMGIDGSDWLPFIKQIPVFAKRIQSYRIHNVDATDIINFYDSKDTLFFVDPPYLNETRSTDRHYAFEMSPEQHRALLKVLCECKGMVYLCGYRSAMYDSYLRGWCRVDWPVKSLMSHSEGSGRERTESMWAKDKAGLFMVMTYGS